MSDCLTCEHQFSPEHLGNPHVMACRHPTFRIGGNCLIGNRQTYAGTAPSWCPLEHVHDFGHRKVSGAMMGTRQQIFRCCSCGLSEPMALLLAEKARTAKGTFQQRVGGWMQACFGAAISADRIERNHRFLEEALELVQANGCTQSEAHQLVDYVFGREVGDLRQEVGGVMVTLAALCLASGADMVLAGEAELARINHPDTIIKIRAKQAAKPKHSPLPEHTAPRAAESCFHAKCPSCGAAVDIIPEGSSRHEPSEGDLTIGDF